MAKQGAPAMVGREFAPAQRKAMPTAPGVPDK